MSDFDFASLDFVVPIDEDTAPRKMKSVPIYTLDLETDPFLAGRYPQPFCAGLYDGCEFRSTWGADCVERMFDIIADLPPGLIYMHNGGRFDIFFMMPYITGFPALIINGRIVRTYTKSKAKKPHEIRDSFAIMPFGLGKYKKDEIDYNTFEADVRENHKHEILSYLKGDCVYLHELCVAFVDMFGPKLTIGSTSMKELRKLHTFENLGPLCDEDIRSQFYYGGRVECFKKGILPGEWKVYDVNSMYPFSMKNFLHPIDTPEAETRKVRKTTSFITVEGKNYGAFPVRTKQGLRFDIDRGTFHVSIHEWEAALRNNLFEPTRIIRCINFRNRNTFAEFVDTFYQRRNEAKASGDDIHSLFYKFVLNSAYGKFAQNSARYKEYTVTDGSVNLTPLGWTPFTVDSVDSTVAKTYIIWQRKPQDEIARMYNVATGASITGAARSILIDALAKADEPIYCDTDSIVCKNLPGVPHDANELGAWKLEANADLACIGGKKLYALFKDGQCVKQANKGVKITADEIKAVCSGAVVESKRNAPSFHLDGSHSFITRRVRMI